jgi:chemotaxis protein methyltransferase CheR
MRSITTTEFSRFQRFIFDEAGITLSDNKQALVTGRLGKRLACHGLDSFGDYFEMLASGRHPDEVQVAVDLLTTNETYFFREAKHFEFLREQALAARDSAQAYRVWSAASSSGEEAYSVAMVLADCLGDAPWEVLGTDVSSRVLEQAVRGLFTMERARHISPQYLRRFCLKGTGAYAGRLLIDPGLRSHVKFGRLNLNQPLPLLGQFDLVLLRNVLIYFNEDTKRSVVSRILPTIRPGGYFFVGHSESLNGITDALEHVAPSVYRQGS